MADEPLSNDSHSEPDPHVGSESEHSAEPAPHADYPASTASDTTAEINQPARYIQPSPSDSSSNLTDPEEEGGPVKSFLEHLEDLRWVLIKIIASVLVAMTLCMVGSPQIVHFLKLPLDRSNAKVKLEIFGPIGGFTVSMKKAFWGGLCLALPYVLYVIAQFVMPALKKNEKPYFRKAFVIGGGLFFIGLIICYWWVMPIAIYGMAQFSEWLGLPPGTWRAEEYFQFVVMF